MTYLLASWMRAMAIRIRLQRQTMRRSMIASNTEKTIPEKKRQRRGEVKLKEKMMLRVGYKMKHDGKEIDDI